MWLVKGRYTGVLSEPSISTVCGIEASYIPDMLVPYSVIALVLGST